MPPRPSGTDGTDHAYRMTIENRYRRLAEQRRTLRGLELASVLLVLLRTGYQQLPSILQGGQTPAASLPLLITTAASLLFYRLASSNKQGIQEGRFVLTLFSVVKLLMTAQILLDMYNQHKVYLGEKQRAFVVASYLNSKIPYNPGPIHQHVPLQPICMWLLCGIWRECWKWLRLESLSAQLQLALTCCACGQGSKRVDDEVNGVKVSSARVLGCCLVHGLFMAPLGIGQ
ncbi:hypothetical protein WJX74_005556 [Apatococcus lobatus]|uniref:Uncharacterized protein n=1 Tax=Apatococcus lobatus TaxID=904363 RepID=A0AAW1QKW2_9CHLO